MKLFQNKLRVIISLLLVGFFFSLIAVAKEQIEPEKMFDLDNIPICVLYVSSNNWQTLLNNYDNDPHDSSKINLEQVVFYPTANGKTSGAIEIIPGGQLSLKGNAWRIRPEGWKSGDGYERTPHQKGMGIYNQANFKVKFGNSKYGYDKVDLKCFINDYNKCRDTYAYYMTERLLRDWKLDKLGDNKFTKNNYSIAPFCSYVHLFIAITGDNAPNNKFNPLDLSMVTELNAHAYDYGLYKLMEENNSDGYLKSRFGSSKNGYLWKGSQNFQVQYINMGYDPWPGFNLDANLYVDPDTNNTSITPYSLKWLDAQIATTLKNPSSQGVIFGVKESFYRPSYSFQGDDEDYPEAVKLLTGFIYNLNLLGVDNQNISDLENWLSNGQVPAGWTNRYSNDINDYKFDYKTFIATLAIHQALGAWDNYVNNSNNYSLYFDTKNKIVYLLPYDLKLTLGVMCEPPKEPYNCAPMGLQSLYNYSYIARSLYEYGQGNAAETYNRHPLVRRLLQIPSYNKLYKKYLLKAAVFLEGELNSNFTDSIGQWYKLIYNNFYQGNLNNGNVPYPYTAYSQKVSESTNVLDYIYTCNVPSGKNYIQVPNNTTNVNKYEGYRKDFYTVIRDSTTVGWGTWFGPAANLTMFSNKGNIWDGRNSTPSNFISTSINNIRSQVSE